MQQTTKANSVITGSWDEATGLMTFNVLGEGSLTLDTTKMHADNRARAMFHGLYQRVPDSAAIGRADKEGRIIPEAERRREKFNRMKRLIEHYESGSPEWGLVARGASPAATDGLTYRAFAIAAGCTVDEARTRIAAQAAKRGESVQKLLATYRAADGKVRTEYERLRDERDAGETSGEDLLTEAMEG